MKGEPGGVEAKGSARQRPKRKDYRGCPSCREKMLKRAAEAKAAELAGPQTSPPTVALPATATPPAGCGGCGKRVEEEAVKRLMQGGEGLAGR